MSGPPMPRESAQPPRRSLDVSLPVLAWVALALGFAWYTGQVWEDYLITFRHSRNLVDGAGLVYQPGERVQGFTSPLGVLIPAVVYWVSPGFDYRAPLFGMQLIGLGVLAAGLVVLLRRMSGAFERVFTVMLLALQVKAVAFSVNGQESALMLGFLALGCVAAVRGPSAWKAAGLTWAGLMWTRPDSVVYVGALGAAGVWLANPTERGPRWRALGKSGVLAALVYGPWFVWAWSYYGSPVPHTILAKIGLNVSDHHGFDLIAAYLRAGIDCVGRPFDPIYAQSGGWPSWLFWLTRGLGIVSAVAWVLPRAAPLVRVCSWVFCVGIVYLISVDVAGYAYPWYFPPLGLCGAVVVAHGVAAVWTRVRGAALARTAWAAGTGILIGALAWSFVFAVEQQRVRQQFVERGVREQVGRWLRPRVGPNETVFLEPIGYIGYFSGAHVLDYPGLVTPRVVEARHRGAKTFIALIAELQPDWIVSRVAEYRVLERTPFFTATYERVQDFWPDVQLLDYRNFPGSGYLLSDAHFIVSRRRSAGETASAPKS